MKTRSKIICLLVLAGGSLLSLPFVTSRAGVPKAGNNHVNYINQKPVATSEQVPVPAGQFLMGCSSDLYPDGCDGDTFPVHAVYLDDFYIDRTEVTNAQYNACVEAGACRERLACESETRPNYCENPTYEDYPVIQVDWARAKEYCTWVGKRLPTEAEWEKAARGTDLRKYPWGNEGPNCERLNYTKGDWYHLEYCHGDTVPVGSYPNNASPYGALDMAGNVSEWVNDWYETHYYYESPYYNPPGPEMTGKREHLVRGGSWKEDYGGVTTFVRLDESEIYKRLRIGFRCVQTASDPILSPTPTPTPTPVPTPTPSPTPTPFASDTIGPDGGLLWLADPGHLTLLEVPPGAVDSETAFTLTFDHRAYASGDLYGVGHFFHLGISPPLTWSGSTGIPGSAAFLPKLTLGFTELGGVISDTLDLFYLDATGWTTKGIFVSERADSYLVAWIRHSGTFGLMGETNRLYLPILLHKMP